jgi:sortilin (neurotensin receptor 3)
MSILRGLRYACRRRPVRRVAALTVGGPIVAAATVAAVALSSSTRPVPNHGAHITAARADIKEAEAGEDPAAPGQYLELKQSSAKHVSLAQVRRARQQARAIATATDAGWQLIGPSNIGGRVVDLVVDPSHADTIYIAASGGGIWKSTDAGATFTPAWPSSYVQNMGAIARGPDGTLWVGTGEANPSGGGLTFTGDGVYKSSDGGQTWQNVGLVNSAAIGRIVVNPQNANEVWVAAAGWISYSAGERGIYHTTNGGTTWQLALAAPNATTGGIDVALAPGNPNRVYAALWDHKRNNGARTYGGIGSGLFRSDNSGGTWTRLQNIVGPACSFDAAGTGLAADASLGRIGVAIAPSDASRVYVVSGTPYGPDKGYYISVNGGDSFVCGGQAYQTSSGYQWWFGRLWVDPANPNHLFNADVSLRESQTAGVAWAPVTGPHADQHGMAWDPNVANRVYLGNDGGIYRSDNNGVTWIHGVYQPWNQSYHLAVAQDDPTRLATGLQDNGSVRTWTASAPPVDLTQWNSFGGGDGHFVAIDPLDHTYYYECFQPSPPSQSCAGKHDSGGTTTTTSFSNSAWPSGMRWTTDTPLALDPTNPSTLYIGGTVLGRSTNRGASFTVISPNDPNSLPGPVPPGENDLGPFYANEYATISAIAPAKTAPNTIYVGTDTGRVWKTTDLGANWTQLQGLPERWVNAIVVDPTNANHVFAAFSGYREGDHAANVWESSEGTTWSNISGNLPNAPVEMLIYDQPHDQLYAATDFGVFSLQSGMTTWNRYGTGLPNTPVLDVKLSGDGQTLFAATFGRSVWKVAVESPTAVRLRSFSATRAGNAVRLHWRTGAEARLLGFDLYRRVGKRNIRLNRSLIPAQGKTGGGSYSYVDRTRVPARYRLQGVTVDGSRVWLGSTRAS